MKIAVNSTLAARFSLHSDDQLTLADSVADAVDRKLRCQWNKIFFALKSKKTQAEKKIIIRTALYDIWIDSHQELKKGFQKIADNSFIASKKILGEVIPIGHLNLQTTVKRLTEATKASIKKKMADAIFKPLSPEKVEQIVKGTTAGMSWQGRLAQQSNLVGSPEQLATLVTSAYAAGATPAQLAALIKPQVAGVAASARRIARNESMRIAHETRMEAFADLGEMVSGYQIHAIMDSRVRPHHAARSGTVYSKNPKGDERPLSEMPRPPMEADGTVAHNCRCWLTPVLEIQTHIEEDPAAKAVFTDAAGRLIPNPAVYTQWFDRATQKDKEKVVGVKRLKLMKELVPIGQSIRWGHFIDPETGKLLGYEELEVESEIQRKERMNKFDSVIDKRLELTKKVYTHGYIPPDPTTPDKVVPPIEPVIDPVIDPIVPIVVPPPPVIVPQVKSTVDIDEPVSVLSVGGPQDRAGYKIKKHSLVADDAPSVPHRMQTEELHPDNFMAKDMGVKKVAFKTPSGLPVIQLLRNLEAFNLDEAKSSNVVQAFSSLVNFLDPNTKNEIVAYLRTLGYAEYFPGVIANTKSEMFAYLRTLNAGAGSPEEIAVVKKMVVTLKNSNYVKTLLKNIEVRTEQLTREPAVAKKNFMELLGDDEAHYLAALKITSGHESHTDAEYKAEFIMQDEKIIAKNTAIAWALHDITAKELEHGLIIEPEFFKTYKGTAKKFFQKVTEPIAKKTEGLVAPILDTVEEARKEYIKHNPSAGVKSRTDEGIVSEVDFRDIEEIFGSKYKTFAEGKKQLNILKAKALKDIIEIAKQNQVEAGLVVKGSIIPSVQIDSVTKKIEKKWKKNNPFDPTVVLNQEVDFNRYDGVIKDANEFLTQICGVDYTIPVKFTTDEDALKAKNAGNIEGQSFVGRAFSNPDYNDGIALSPIFTSTKPKGKEEALSEYINKKLNKLNKYDLTFREFLKTKNIINPEKKISELFQTDEERFQVYAEYLQSLKAGGWDNKWHIRDIVAPELNIAHDMASDITKEELVTAIKDEVSEWSHKQQKACDDDETEKKSAYIHEMGHQIENRADNNFSKAFLFYRAGLKDPYDMKLGYHPEMTFGPLFQKANEGGLLTNKKNGKNAGEYTAKRYSGGSTEVITMGLERLFHEPADFFKNDPEYANFVLHYVSVLAHQKK